jgi:hypothetical protein
MFTKDHIQPKTKGGKDTIDNLRTMCASCNVLRGNHIVPLDIIVEARHIAYEQSWYAALQFVAQQSLIFEEMELTHAGGHRVLHPQQPESTVHLSASANSTHRNPHYTTV